jgi:hypothetical protein
MDFYGLPAFENKRSAPGMRIALYWKAYKYGEFE